MGRGALMIEYGLLIALAVTFCLLITLAPST
jgi:Flp pilus assembly pilin Flp